MRVGVLFLIGIIAMKVSCKEREMADNEENECKVIVSAESTHDEVYNIFDSKANSYELWVSSESASNNYCDLYCSVYTEPNRSDSRYEMVFGTGNGSSRLSDKWFKFGNSVWLILAKQKIRLIFTKR